MEASFRNKVRYRNFVTLQGGVNCNTETSSGVTKSIAFDNHPAYVRLISHELLQRIRHIVDLLKICNYLAHLEIFANLLTNQHVLLSVVIQCTRQKKKGGLLLDHTSSKLKIQPARSIFFDFTCSSFALLLTPLFGTGVVIWPSSYCMGYILQSIFDWSKSRLRYQGILGSLPPQGRSRKPTFNCLRHTYQCRSNFWAYRRDFWVK